MDWGAPPVVNDDAMAAFAADAVKEVLSEENVITEVEHPNMGGEDFAYYLMEVPGAFMFLSSANPEKGTDIAHHNPKFNVDEDRNICHSAGDKLRMKKSCFALF